MTEIVNPSSYLDKIRCNQIDNRLPAPTHRRIFVHLILNLNAN